jgi:uncharacterized Zn finger protein (UPF0148 family)
MPIRRSECNEFYICLECGMIRRWDGNVSCKTCGGKIIGPVDKATADAAASDPKIKQKVISNNQRR